MDFRTCVAVLLVEDDESLRKRVADSLEAEGFQVHQAESGERALQIVRVMPRPALVLADLMTSSIDARALVAALDPHDRFVILPVVVVGIGMGLSQYNTHRKQPIDLDDLLRIVESLCVRRM